MKTLIEGKKTLIDGKKTRIDQEEAKKNKFREYSDLKESGHYELMNGSCCISYNGTNTYPKQYFKRNVPGIGG